MCTDSQRVDSDRQWPAKASPKGQHLLALASYTLAAREGGLKILVIDDHPLVRDAMSRVVAQLGEEVEVLEAADVMSALGVAAVHPDLDLVLLDLNLPGVHGVPALERFRREHPAAPVVIVSALRDRASVVETIRSGAMGFIPKSAPRESVVSALRVVLSGSIYVPPEAATEEILNAYRAMETASVRSNAAQQLGLTPRQGHVLALVMCGRSNKEICRTLGLAERTVKVHVTAVLNALKVANRTQAVIAATRLGLQPDNLFPSASAERTCVR